MHRHVMPVRPGLADLAADRAEWPDLTNTRETMLKNNEKAGTVNLSPSTTPYNRLYGSFRRPPVPRKPRFPAQGQRTQLAPTASRRREPDVGQKPEEQPGLLWNKFRPETAGAEPAE